MRFKIDKFDFGWVVISFGMAIGAGIVLTPISVGTTGFLVFLLAAIIAYPGIYVMQKIYIQTISISDKPRVYSEVISEVMGSSWGAFLSIVYFLMMVVWTIIYAEVVTSSLASYLYSFGLVSDPALEKNVIFSFILILVLVLVGIKSQKLLVRVSTFLVFMLLLAVLLVSIAMIPLWNISNLAYLPPTDTVISNTIVMIPFALTSILFMGSISPMVISYRLRYQDSELAEKKSLTAMKFSFYLLLIIVLFFILSFALVLPQHLAKQASESGDSVFVILDKTKNSTTLLYICGIIINICAILTSFLSILAGMSESLRGLIYKLLNVTKQDMSHQKVELFANIIMFLMLWLAVVINFNVYFLVPLTGPIYCLVGCFIPVYIVYKTPALREQYSKKTLVFIMFVGVMLAISPLLSLG